MPSGVSRFLSRRDRKAKLPIIKYHDGRRNIYDLFNWTENRKNTREEDKSINDIRKRLEAADILDIQQSHIEYAIRWTGGHTDVAHEICVLLHDTSTGDLRNIDTSVNMVGAENREMVTCYLDSLLFAMFARMDSFESILSFEYPDHATNTLAHALRYWVNMLRSGRLITTDVAKFIQESLAECGWKDASDHKQQDVSEAFSFITDKLALPLLTLKMDVYHTGKDDMDDHRIVKERLLDVAIPDPPEDAPENGYTMKLEDCLENYFNNKIEVKRYLQRRNTVNYGQARPRVLTAESRQSPEPSDSRGSTNSIFRQRTVFSSEETDILEEPESPNHIVRDDIDVHPGRKDSAGGSARFRKEVLMPAWQFFHLIPWSTNKHKPDEGIATDAQVAAHFATKKPVLGICLKRYSFGVGNFKRLNTYVDIPLEIRLPHFISDGSEDDGYGSSFSRFKLSLQSIICHRGVVLEMGHYISLVRPSPEEIAAEFEEGQTDSRFQWYMHDDLAKDKRVTRVDIRKALKEETPYLLFYQVQPIGEFDDLDEIPPTYAEATGAIPTPVVGSASTTMTQPSSTSLHTVLGTSSASSPPLVAVNSIHSESPPALSIVQPLSLAHPNAQSFTNLSLNAPNQPVSIIVPEEDVAISSRPNTAQLDLSALSSFGTVAGAKLEVPQGSTLTVAGSSDMTHDSESNRYSFTTSNPSPVHSDPVTPAEDGKHREDYIMVDPIDDHRNSEAEQPISRSNSLNKRSWRKRGKEHDDKNKDVDTTPSKDKWHNSRNWLSGSGSTKSRSRPTSQATGGFVRGLKEVMSRDKLSTNAHTGGIEDHHHTMEGESHGDSSPIDSAAPSFTFVAIKEKDRDKEKTEKPTRHKSSGKKKIKAKKDVNGHVTTIEGEIGDGGSDVSNGERECALM